MSLESIMKDFNKKFKDEGELVHIGLADYDYDRIPFTSPRLNYMTYGGVPVGKLIEFYGEEHGGKALPLDCNILTPFGYKKMRDIELGDTIIDGNGEHTTVCGVYPQGVKPMYRITFSDHSTIDCSDEHLWEVNYHGSHKITSKVVNTTTLANNYKTVKNGRNYFKYSINTPIVKDIDCKEDLPIDPYLLGVLIGDGSLSSKCGKGLSVTLPEQDIRRVVSSLLSDWDMKLRNKSGTFDYRICHKGKMPNQYSNQKTLRQELSDLGLLCKSVEKHIPHKYLFTSVENRLRLLQGLYDTDGYTTKNGHASFDTSSKDLSDDFAFLVRSLGGLDMVTSSIGSYKKDDGYVYCSTSYHHSIVFRNGIIPCTSEKHLKRYKVNRDGAYYRKITDVSIIEPTECQCIKVTSDCHTFIAENVTVTHNTTTALDIVANYQHMENARKVLYCDCENTLDIKWARTLGVDVDNMIILSPTNQGAETIFQFILDAIETDEIGLVIIDSLGVMVSNQAMEKSVEEKTYGGIAMALTNFSKKAEGLCQKTQCTLIGINQMRDDLNSMYGGLTTTGGRAWKHNTSVRLEFKRGKFFDFDGKDLTRGAENPAGNYVLVTMVKNKTCRPDRRTGFYTLTYLDGIDYLGDLIEVAIKYGIVDKSGAWFTVVDTETGEALSDKIQGQGNLKKFLSDETNVDVLARIEELVNKEVDKVSE